MIPHSKEKAALYVRVSTEEQATDGFSIKAQIREMEAYAKRNGLIVSQVYADEGFSGKDMAGRPFLQEMLQDAKNKQFQTLVIHRIDRLSRDLHDALSISETLAEYGVQLVSVTENIDLTSSMGKMLFQLMGSFAEFERKTISDRVKTGMIERAKQGYYNGGKVLGYESIAGKLTVIRSEAEVVREIFQLAATGKGYKAISNQMNLQGFKTKKGNLFSINTIKTILENPIYIGKIRYNRLPDWETKRRKGKNNHYVLAEGKHPAIIDQKLWDLVHELKQKRKELYAKKAKETNRTPGFFLLTGLIRCPKCASKMVSANSMQKGDRFRIYVCGTFHNKGPSGCRAHSIGADRIEKEVLSQVEKFLQNKRFHHTWKHPLNPAIHVQKEQVQRYEDEKNELIDQLSEDRIDFDHFQAAFDRLNASIADITEQIPVTGEEETEFHLLHLFQTAAPVQKRELIKQFVESVSITLKAPRKLEEVVFQSTEVIEQQTIQQIILKGRQIG